MCLALATAAPRPRPPPSSPALKQNGQLTVRTVSMVARPPSERGESLKTKGHPFRGRVVTGSTAKTTDVRNMGNPPHLPPPPPLFPPGVAYPAGATTKRREAAEGVRVSKRRDRGDAGAEGTGCIRVLAGSARRAGRPGSGRSQGVRGLPGVVQTAVQ